MKVLVIDIGGTHVKMLATSQAVPRMRQTEVAPAEHAPAPEVWRVVS